MPQTIIKTKSIACASTLTGLFCFGVILLKRRAQNVCICTYVYLDDMLFAFYTNTRTHYALQTLERVGREYVMQMRERKSAHTECEPFQ